MDQPLSLALRTETASAHDDAEGSAFVEQDMACLCGGDVDGRLADGDIHIVPDLSGGQINARMVQRHYGIDPAGLRFYHVEEIPKPKPCKDAYRATLDSLVLDEATRRRVLDAAVDSFELNRRVFADLGAARAPEHAAAGGPA